MTDTNITSLNRPTNPNEPASWWRVLCTVATSRLIITGDLEGERTSRRLARGDVRFLEKPFDTHALLRAIREALDVRR